MIQILTYLLSVTCLFAQTQAKTITVNVGDGGLVFTPDSVTAAKGDMIQFNYIKGVSRSRLISPRFPAWRKLFLLRNIAEGQLQN